MPDRSALYGLALVTCATLMLQVVLTRIFSVVMWYHMSLVSVSMAMFGMTVGSMIVHRYPAAFTPERAAAACARHALWFGLSIAGGLLVCLNTPFEVRTTFMGLTAMAYWNAVAALPFVFSGICVCVALTRFPKAVGKLYAADLAGAAAGCLVVVWLLDHLDAPSAVLATAAVAVTGAALFALPVTQNVETSKRRNVETSKPETRERQPQRAQRGRGERGGASADVARAGEERPDGGIVGVRGGGGYELRGPAKRRLAIAGVLVLVALLNAVFQPIRIQYTPGYFVADDAEYRRESWNVFSYVTVTQPQRGPTYWGPGDRATWDDSRLHLFVQMDTRASTAMVNFDGGWEGMDWLMEDVVSVVHDLRPAGPALVVGVGAGRDVLTALVPSRGTRRVVGVDINPRMIELLTETEVEFSGGIGRLPNVSLHVDEARSWLARSDEKFQVITVPLVDTSAASAAGAYALTENSLYTVEAFRLFLDRLSDDGVLSVSRWWYGGRIGEPHRLVALAAAALRDSGVADPRAHLVALRGGDIVTVLVSRRPFTESDLAKLAAACERFGFEPLLTPAGSAGASPSLSAVVSSSRGAAELLAAAGDSHWVSSNPYSGQIDLSPPTDDRPFFFRSYRLRNLFGASSYAPGQAAISEGDAGVGFFDRNAMLVLAALLIVLALLTVGVFVWPLRGGGSGAATSLAYFGAIGLGFMFFESSQMQRLNIFLGNPVYALTVVLFTLLLSSSLGAFVAGRLWERVEGRAVALIAIAILVVLVVLGLATPFVTRHYEAASTPLRIASTVALLAPAGVVMGMFFPVGLRLAERVGRASLAWCWGINGMTSTFAAVAAIAMSISFGITATYWLGVACYAAAGVLGMRLKRA